MKKILSLVLILMFVMTAFISCGGNGKEGENSNTEDNATTDGGGSGGINYPDESENTAGDNIVDFS